MSQHLFLSRVELIFCQDLVLLPEPLFHNLSPMNPGIVILCDSAYAACGEAASALHAMALLQVLQAKALRDLHEGGHDPEVLSELRTATDLALRATKVTPRSLGCAMSTMVGQECHLWLCLADMREADKARFLNAPVSQKQTEAIRHILPRRAAAASTPPPRSSLQQSSAVEPAAGQEPRPSRPPPSGGASSPETDDPGMGVSALVNAPLPPPEEGRAENLLFLFFLPGNLTVSGTQNLDKRAVSSISGSPQGTGGL